jgi:hypothetical protein
MKRILQILKKNIKNSYYELVLWIHFIKSIKFDKNSILIFNYEKWHLGIDYQFRKKSYKEFLNSRKHNVICIDLNSHFAVFIFDIILNGFKSNFNRSELSKNFFTSEFFLSYNYGYWDSHIRKKIFFNKEIPTDRKKYRKIFNDFINKPLNLNHWNRIYNIFNNQKVKGLVLTQQAYEELPLARFALDNNIKIIYFESGNGIEVFNPSSHPLMNLSSKGFNQTAKTFSENELKKQASIIKKRIMGIEDDSERVFLRNLKAPELIKNYFSFNNKAKKTLCLYLHAFTDSPNWNRDTEDYSPFLDFYEMALYVIEYCAKNNIPMIIKPHPESHSYSNDKYYLKALVDVTLKYKESHNLSVEWVGNDFINFYLTKISNPVVVTGRGTVVSECSYLGIPSISFCKSPWQDFKNVSFLVNSEVDFEKIFPIIDKLYQAELSKKEGIILSAMLERGMKTLAFKLGLNSATVSKRHKVETAWELRQEL